MKAQAASAGAGNARQVTAYVGIGANLGDAVASVRSAMDDIDAIPGCWVSRRSSLYLTAPIDSSGPDYVNAVVEVVTELIAPLLLQRLQKLELLAGRERPYLNAPRTLDLDLLLFGNSTIVSSALIVPHPRMRERAFVLQPLAEIAAERVPPDWLSAVAHQSARPLPLH